MEQQTMTIWDVLDKLLVKWKREAKERSPRVVPVVKVLTDRVFTIGGVGIHLTDIEAWSIGEALDKAGLLGAPSPPTDPE